MLVLSRKENEKVVFPQLGIAVQILRVAGGKARLGVEAPHDVSVVRHEIASPEQLEDFMKQLVKSGDGGSHKLRNELQTVLLGLSLIQKQLACNLIEEAEETLRDLIHHIRALDSNGTPTPRMTRIAARRRALVVEDNSNERRLLAGYLALSGFEVEAVDDGVQALDYLASHERPDAVVMDMQLPRLDGAGAVGVLRSDPRFQGLKVYAVSGMDQCMARVPIGPEGVDHWLSKPVDPQQLVELINAETLPSIGCG